MNLLRLNLDSPVLLERKLADGKSLGAHLDHSAEQWENPHAILLQHTGQWSLGWLNLPSGGAWVDQCYGLAQELRKFTDTLVVCGIGGSALGLQAVLKALGYTASGYKSVITVDNVDPSLIAAKLSALNLAGVALNVVSKSGSTLETIAGFTYCFGELRKADSPSTSLAKRIVATTDPKSGLLRDLAIKAGWHMLPVPADVGGRFSVLSPAGLFPLAFAGVDIPSLLNGAQQMQDWITKQPVRQNPAWVLAALHYLLHTQAGVHTTVHYIYGDPLNLLGDWFRQLWAESLAKAEQIDGSPSGICLTPAVARGSTDQHSQNQLYMEGPDDKIYGFVTADRWPTDPPITLTPETSDEALSYLQGRTFGHLLRACYEGTRDALLELKRPVYEIAFPKLEAENIGAYLQFWMLTTAYAGLMYNVNAYNQPGVERSKQLTKQRLAQ